MGGHILNLSHMNQVIEHSIEADGTGRITVEPGINLIELRKEITADSEKSSCSGRRIRQKRRLLSEELWHRGHRESVICYMERRRII